MDKTEALKKWSDACSVVELQGTIIRDGNWTTLLRSLRHCADTSTVHEKASLNGDTVIEVIPEPKATAAGKSELKLPPFLLVVR